MSFSSLSASTNGTTITISYSYTGSPTAQIQAYTLIGGVETAVGSAVTTPTNITLSSGSLPSLFQQGSAYGIFLKDDESPANQSTTNYYIYCKTNDANNIYLANSSSKNPFTVADIGTTNKSVVLPSFTNSIGNIFYIKTKNTGNSVYVVPKVTGVSYPILTDTLFLTDSVYSAFEDSINGNTSRYTISTTKACYSFGAITGNDWSILSSYNNTLTLLQDTSTTFSGAFPINLTNQIHLHFYNGVDNLLNLQTLIGNTFHYIIIYRNTSGAANSLYLGFGNQTVVDDTTPPSNNTNYLNIILGQWDIFCLTLYVNTENSKVFIVHTSTNTGIDTGTYPGSGTVITKSLVNVSSSANLQIPVPINSGNYGSIFILKYSPKNSRQFIMRAKTSGELSLYKPGTGFVDNIFSSTETSLCIWLFVGYDSFNNVPIGVVIHQYNN
jgi:hypothetical protein